MKLHRDMELVFDILKKIVESEERDILYKPLELDSYEPDQIGYHLYLMDQAGLLSANVRRACNGNYYPDTKIFGNDLGWT